MKNSSFPTFLRFQLWKKMQAPFFSPPNFKSEKVEILPNNYILFFNIYHIIVLLLLLINVVVFSFTHSGGV